MIFKLKSSFSPSGDQSSAIKNICKFIKSKSIYQTLLGVTGSGKTYTMANIINKLQMPTLIMTHNKTLAAQLYSEFKGFFPHNKVEYFISHFDYYQPEAYIPRSDLFIDKDSSINDDLERLRLAATTSLLTCDDVIVVASVSANYGLGNPLEYKEMLQRLVVGDSINQRQLLLRLTQMGYSRNDGYFDRGNFRVIGDVLDIYPAYSEDMTIRVEFFGDDIESISQIDHIEQKEISKLNEYTLYSANQFIVGQNRLKSAIKSIEKELGSRLAFFKSVSKDIEYNRLKSRTEFDLEMIETTGICKGIENYSRHLTGKKEGETPYSLLDYFEIKNMPYLLIVDESHVALPQFRGMYAGDRSRKEILVEHGFRLPSALDNRPLKYEEFINKASHYLFVSATPQQLELNLSGQNVAEQIIRPTGLLDPLIEIKPIKNQVEVLHDEIKKTISKGHRVLITTLTKKMSEDLSTYYLDLGLKVKYMHSDIDAIERNTIIRSFRLGEFDVLIGINLLREGLDLPEVALVGILDADKEGFLRSQTSLIQTIGRAARNAQGKVILFADKMTDSMKVAIQTTQERREKQHAYNIKHNITPKSTKRRLDENLSLEDEKEAQLLNRLKKEKIPPKQKQEIIKDLKIKMQKAAKDLEFEKAISLRDEIAKLQKA